MALSTVSSCHRPSLDTLGNHPAIGPGRRLEILKSKAKTQSGEMSAEDGETDDDFEDDFEDSDDSDDDD
jgi:hypothetical protein